VPVTVDSGPQGTDDPLAIDLKISMDEKVGMVDTNTSQFGTMLMKLGASQARSFKEQWLEDEFLPTNTALSATAAAGDTNLAITTSERTRRLVTRLSSSRRVRRSGSRPLALRRGRWFVASGLCLPLRRLRARRSVESSS
jgi:hypothetical protein